MHINNRSYRGGGYTDDRAAIAFGATDTDESWYLGQISDVAHSSNKLGLFRWGTGWVQSWDTNGNVGIGTTDPLATLHVGAGTDTPDLSSLIYASTTGSSYITARNSTADIDVAFGASSIGGIIGTRTAHDLYFQSNSSNRMILTSSGNVGIGTTDPYAELDIYDGSSDSGVIIRTGTTTWFHLYQPYNVANLRIGTGAIGSNDLVTIQSNGNVGIGTTAPGKKLDVAGDIRFSGDLLKGSTQLTYPITLPNTGGTVQWVKLGTLTIAQHGKSAFIKVVANTGYNANINQNYEVYIRFKTSNANSVDANGFCADSSYYTMGRHNWFASTGNIKWVANAAGCSATAYDLYMNFGSFTGSAAFYTVETSDGTWVHSGATGQADPGVASDIVQIPIHEFNVRSNSLVVNSSGNVGIGTTEPGTKLEIEGATWGSNEGGLRLEGTKPTIKLADTGNANYFLLHATDDSGTGRFSIYHNTDDSTSWNHLFVI